MPTRASTRGYSLLMVLMLMGLLGVAVGGLLGVILRGARTSGSMLDRRTTFYACDGMGRQLAALGQAFLARNTAEDVPEAAMQEELRRALPGITPAGFDVDPRDLVIPNKPLVEPTPIEIITTGPFAGLEVKLQVIDMRFQATRHASGAVCRSEQSLSLGRIALFQFFVFADLPLLDLVGTNDESMLMRGRIHTNGRICLGGGAFASADSRLGGPFAVRLDVNMTAVDRILHGQNGSCRLGGNDVGIVGNRARGPAPTPPRPDRLLNASILESFSPLTESGCNNAAFCRGGWRSFTLRQYLGRLQDTDHEVQELTLPVDPPEMRSQRGWAANGSTVSQFMRSGSTRPNTRFLVEPELTNDPPNFGRNKLAHKAQIRIIDGVWYVKDPGTDNSAAGDADDGPWPGIPIWSDHPGEFTTTLREGVEGGVPLQVGQSDIRAALDAGSDPRLAKAKWSARRRIGASPTPRRFSYYAFVDHTQAAAAESGPRQGQLSPEGQGLQFGRVHTGTSNFLDVDPPAVISYGGLAPVQLAGAFNAAAGPPTEGDNTYWLPGVRFADQRFNPAAHVSYAPRGRDDAGYCGFDPARLFDDVRSSVLVPAVPQPLEDRGDGVVSAISYPAPRQPLPADGTAVPLAPGNDGWGHGRLCAGDNEGEFRRRMRLALLDATRTGFVDTNNHRDTRLNAAAKENVLPINFNLHAFQEALADKTPGELGSYFCDEGCLWPKFNGTVFISDTWRGSMLGSGVFPDGIAAPPPNPVVTQEAVDLGERQPHIPVERVSTTGPLPFPLCSAPSDEAAVARAQVVGRRFVEADELDVHTGTAGAAFTMPYNDGKERFENSMLRTMAAPPILSPREASTTPNYPDPAATVPGSFRIPECERYKLSGGVWSSVVPAAVRVINGRTINYNRRSCGESGSAPCLPELSSLAVSHARGATRQLDDGLNVVTNMPMYIMGDINQTSEVNNVDTGRRATDWIPVMFASDSITTMSNAWDDEHSRWGVSTNDNDLNVESFTERAARTTRYTMLLLTGLVGAGSYNGSGRDINASGTSGGGLHNAMRLMEDWRGERHIFRGAMVLGWMPVFTQWRVGRSGDRSYEPPALRNWQFDRHLNATVNQPPDSPVFDVTALRNWRRE